jgi:hypothetical protein
MFTKAKVTAVTKSGIHTNSTQVKSSVATLSGGGSVSQFMAGQYNYIMSGLLPATPDMPDSTSLAYFYRDIYLHDNVGGSCVDIQSTFPFSDWELRGLVDNELHIFNSALERLNIRDALPQIAMSYMVDGFYAGSLVYDQSAKNFMDMMTHDAMQCSITGSPFTNMDPKINVTVSSMAAAFMQNPSQYGKRYLETMPRSFVDLLKEGAFVLDPLTTLYVARRGLTDRPYQSYLHRLLPMYLIEKAMFRGTLTEAMRRQRAMTHVTAGDDLWTPTSDELNAVVQNFMDAERDPMGGWIATRNAVQASDIRPAGEFWKWTDMSDVMTAYKLRSLGISEALLSGDASYAAAESAYSTFLETTNGFRTHLTQQVFYKKIFPIIAVANGLVKDEKKERHTDSIIDFLYNTTNRGNLKQPILHWHKELTAKAEDNLMDMLEKVSEKGVPIPIKMWLAAAGVDKDNLVRDHMDDEELRKQLGLAPAGQQHPDVEDEGDESAEGDADAPPAPPVTTASLKWKFGAGGFRKKPLLSRDFGDGEMFTIGKTGQKQHVPNSASKGKDANWRIAKIAASLQDPHRREQVRMRNVKTTGRDQLSI